MPLSLDAPVDLSFLDSPTALDVQRRDFLAGAIHHDRWACTLTDEVLCAPDKPKPDGARTQALCRQAAPPGVAYRARSRS